MSYFGTRIYFNDWSVTIKIHGPLDSFEIDPDKIKSDANGFLNSYKDIAQPSIDDYTNRLVDDMASIYCNGKTRVWVEIITEAMGKSNRIYSATSIGELDVAKV